MGWFTLKWKLYHRLLTFHVDPKLYECISSVKHKRRFFFIWVFLYGSQFLSSLIKICRSQICVLDKRDIKTIKKQCWGLYIIWFNIFTIILNNQQFPVLYSSLLSMWILSHCYHYFFLSLSSFWGVGHYISYSFSSTEVVNTDIWCSVWTHKQTGLE